MTPNGTRYLFPSVERHEEPLRAMPVMDARLDREDALIDVLAGLLVLAVVGFALWVWW